MVKRNKKLKKLRKLVPLVAAFARYSEAIARVKQVTFAARAANRSVWIFSTALTRGVIDNSISVSGVPARSYIARDKRLEMVEGGF